jgi:hypothetical protein
VASAVSDQQLKHLFTSLNSGRTRKLSWTEPRSSHLSLPSHLSLKKISSSYRTCTSSFGNQCRFHFPPGSDHSMLPFTESTKYTYTIGEPLISGDLALEFASPISSLDGPVLILDGVRGSIFLFVTTTHLLRGQLRPASRRKQRGIS